MPSDESFWLHDHQRIAPVAELRECDHRQTERRRCSAWPCLAFLKLGALLPEEQIFGHQGYTRRKERSDERQQPRILQELVRLSTVRTELLRTTGIREATANGASQTAADSSRASGRTPFGPIHTVTLCVPPSSMS